MKYLPPKLQHAGVASKLIQAKNQMGTDNHMSFNFPTMSALLEAR